LEKRATAFTIKKLHWARLSGGLGAQHTYIRGGREGGLCGMSGLSSDEDGWFCMRPFKSKRESKSDSD
jgi:hypothetical protein